ncbi:MAG TPA: hypothetical protein PK990_03945 [Salinivirgaceae bacterium]|nr:hypothetical protein [Salinivirgaceae bacterium]
MKLFLIWALSILTTLGVVFYQKITGPTYPQKHKIEGVTFKLPRSASQSESCKISIPSVNYITNAKLIWKYYPGEYLFDTIPMSLQDGQWTCTLPAQPPAGKLQYYVNLYNNDSLLFSTEKNPAIIRFKGDVPKGALIPHVLFMFIASLFSVVALFMVVFKIGNYTLLARLTVISLLVGGLIFGPIVQKYAFGAYWTGFPFGFDLTDNKTLLVFLIWLIPIFSKSTEWRKRWIIIASISMLIINSIPHSTMGSELNRNSGKVETGR